MRKLLQWTSCLLVLLAVGCGSRLKDERTVELPPSVEKELLIEGISRDQTVHVEVKSPGVPVNVYCYLEKDQADVHKKGFQTGKSSAKILAKEEKKEEINLDVAVPANHNAIVLLISASSKTATAKVKLTN